MTDFLYNPFPLNLFNGQIVCSSSAGVAASTFKVMLVSTGYQAQGSSVRQDQTFVLDGGASSQSAAAFESTTSTGTIPRVIMGIRTLTVVPSTGAGGVARVDVIAPNLTFPAVSSGGGVIGGAVLFAEIANSDSSGRIVLANYETGFPITPNGGDITIAWSSGGIFQRTS